MAESDNTERAARVFKSVVVQQGSEPDASTRETSGNEIWLPSMLLLSLPC